MLDPCEVCRAGERYCDQCYFGYISKEEAHKRFKDLLIKVSEGDRYFGGPLADRYMKLYPNWRDK